MKWYDIVGVSLIAIAILLTALNLFAVRPRTGSSVESFTVHETQVSPQPISDNRPKFRTKVENYIDHLSQIHRKYSGTGLTRDEKNAMVDDTLDMLSVSK